MQYVLKADVEDKKMLWEEGIVTPTPRYPQGRQPVAFMSAKLTFLQGRHVRVATILPCAVSVVSQIIITTSASAPNVRFRAIC